MLTLIIPFVAAMVASLALTPAVRMFARRFGFVAPPSADRWHQRPTALLGGIAIFAGFAISLVVTSLLRPGSTPLDSLGKPGIATLSAATLMFATGLVDDRIKLRPATKLVMQIAAASIVVSMGIRYPLTGWAPIDVVVTVFWFLALTNALNLLDNMDGVATGVAAIAGAFLALSFALQGSWALVAVCLALCGAALGFLPYNFHPASIFMGDSGSLFMGAVLAAVGASFPNAAGIGIVPVMFVPAFVVIVPILDTMLVTVTRTVAGRPITAGGRDHTSHRLVALGLSESRAAVLLYVFAAAGGVLGVTVSVVQLPISTLLSGLFLVLLALLATYLGRMHVYTANERNAGSKVTLLVSDLLYKKRALELLLDVVLFALAYQIAYVIRWDGAIPATQYAIMERSLAIVIGVHTAAFAIVGVYRGVWQQASLADLHRIVKASALSGLATAAALAFLFRESEFSRSIPVLTAMLAALLAGGARVSFRSLDLLRGRMHQGRNTLLYGAGAGGTIVSRELFANRWLRLRPVGFVDDDLLMVGRIVNGIPVLGRGDQLAELLLRSGAQILVLCTNKVDPEKLARIARVCANGGVELLRFKLELQPIETVVQSATVQSPARLAVE